MNQPAPQPVTGPADAADEAAPGDELTRRLLAGRHPSSMVDRPGRLVIAMLSWLLGSVVFARRCVDSLRDADARGRVVYVMRTRSLLDYLYFNVAFRREGIRLVRFANGTTTWPLRTIGAAFRTLLRGRRGLPPDDVCFERVVEGGAPALLFLGQASPDSAGDPAFVAPFLQRLVALQKRIDAPVLVVPLLLVWDKRPDRAQPTLLEEVFGSRQSPGFLKKFFYVIQNFWQSFLHLGAPTVQISSAIDLLDFVRQHADAPDHDLALRLRDQLHDAIGREERVIVGPWVKPARDIRDEILDDPRTTAQIDAVASRSGQTRESLQKNARAMLTEIAADFDLLAIKILSSILTWVWNSLYDGIELDQAGLDRVRRTAVDKRIVLVPSHKSHIDYLVLSYIFYNNGLIPPHIAAGVNLSFWPLGPIFRRSGAFFLRRSFSEDPLYGRMFNAYLVKLLEEGFAIEFFIEGTRSRTGKLYPPRYGMLDMVVGAYLSGNVDQLAFVPVSVGYEKIIEGMSYKAELEGAEKKSEGLADLLRAPTVLRSRYGRVYVEFGEPIDLGEYLQRYHGDAHAAPPPEELERTIRRLAYRVIHHINDVTTVTPSAIAALVILNTPARAIDITTLIREAGFVLGFLQERQARLSRTLRDSIELHTARLHKPTRQSVNVKALDDFDQAFVEETLSQEPDAPLAVASDEGLGTAVRVPVEEALRLLGENRLVEFQRIDAEPHYTVPAERRAELQFYKNNIIHCFVADSVFATALLTVPGPTLDVAQLRERARFLSRLLKYEYCFEERRSFAEVFDRSRSYFEARQWITSPTVETVEFPTAPPAGVEFLRGLILPTIEGYAATARALADGDGEWSDMKTISRRILARGKAAWLRNELLFAESVTRPTVENALKVFREWGVLEQREETKGRKKIRELRVAPEYRDGLLAELVEEVGGMVSAQKRAPGELLRRV